jgi:hypothetical protein
MYNTSDDPRTINKTLNGEIEIRNVRFKDDTNILQPVLDLAYDERIFSKNYVHIGTLSRYYFIKNIITTHNRLYVECEVDVLRTYKNSILDTYAFVVRQGRTSASNDDGQANVLANALIPDDTYPVQANRVVSIIGENDPENGNFGKLWDDNVASKKPTLVLLINGGDGSASN